MHVGRWRGGWCIDYRDVFGRRHRLSYATRREAEAAAEAAREEQRGPARRCEMPNATVREFGAWWLSYLDTLASGPEPRIKPRTVESYRWALSHVYPALGPVLVRDVWSGDLRRLLADLGARLALNSVRIVRATLHTFFEDAIAQGIITTNPVSLGKARRDRVRPTDAQRAERAKALTVEEERIFFTTCSDVAPRYRLLFRVYARAGLRLGEGLGLQLEDVTDDGLWVRRTVGRAGVGQPKGNAHRFVPVSETLADELRHQVAMVRAAGMLAGVPSNEWLFPSQRWTPLDGRRVQQAFRRVLTSSGLPLHYSPHSLRHSYACRMLENGCEITDLQRYLGHSTIRLTVDLYGFARQTRRSAAVDVADDLPR